MLTEVFKSYKNMLLYNKLNFFRPRPQKSKPCLWSKHSGVTLWTCRVR